MTRDNSTDASANRMTALGLDASTIDRVQRAMAGNCHECRGGKRKNMSGGVVSCKLCNGTGRMSGLTVAQIANAAGVGISKTIDALHELKARGVAFCEVVGGCEYWSLNR